MKLCVGGVPSLLCRGQMARRLYLVGLCLLLGGCDSGASVEESILFTGVHVGEGSKIRRAIIEKWVSIPEGTEIGYDRGRDAERFTVTESGIVVVPQGYTF